MILRKATENEIDHLVEISKTAFDTDVTVGGEAPGGPPGYDSPAWHRQMMQEGHLYAYLTEQGRVIGGAALFPCSHALMVGRIFIDPNCFRHGYGMQLMAHIERTFAASGVIRLDTPVWNQRTNRFYRKCGYTEVSRDAESVWYEKHVRAENP